MPNQVSPTVQALVLADHVYVDQLTNKKVIAGTFDTLWARSFPSVLGRETAAFISLRDVRGELPLSLKLVDLSNNEVVMGMDASVAQQEDPLMPIELVVMMPPIPMPHAGTFAIEVFTGSQLIGSARLLVKKMENEA